MSDDILGRLHCAYAKGTEPPCEQCTFCAARAEIEWLREMAYHRNEQLARAWVVGVAGATEVDPIVDPDQRSWNAMTGEHSPETLADVLIDRIDQAQSEIERLRAECARWKNVASYFDAAIVNEYLEGGVPQGSVWLQEALEDYREARRG